MFTFGYSNRLNGPMRALVAVVVGIIMIIYNEQAMNIVVKIIAALLFAAGHLPATFMAIGNSPLIIFRCFYFACKDNVIFLDIQ